MSAAKQRSPYIVGKGYDWALFLAPPLAAMLVGLAISKTSFALAPLDDEGGTGSSFLIGVLIHAHLVAVFARSHGNGEVRRRFPFRFFVVPVVLFAAILSSPWIAVLAMVVATFWDVWHSGAQTFGFARIYDSRVASDGRPTAVEARSAGAEVGCRHERSDRCDRNHGAHGDEGRRLDFWLNQLLYAGPILAGATLIDHLVVLEEFEVFDGAVSDFLVLVPAEAEGAASLLTWIVVLLGAAFVAYYLHAQWRLLLRGRRTSPLKVYLLASTALCSIVTWGFNPWGEAFFIMNAFHAVQYLALVWAMEGKRMAGALGLARRPLGGPITAAVFLGAVVFYGALTEIVDPSIEIFWALTMVVSLMHFWYDAFLWSVQKKHV